MKCIVDIDSSVRGFCFSLCLSAHAVCLCSVSLSSPSYRIQVLHLSSLTNVCSVNFCLQKEIIRTAPRCI